MSQEYCLVLIKPDAVLKGIYGEVISELSQTKSNLIGAKVLNVSKALAEKHYEALKEKKPQVYEGTIKYLTGQYHQSSVIALVYGGEDVIEKIREICGVTHPEKAHPRTIRGKYGRIHSETMLMENVVHASDSLENAEKEIKLWFSPDELSSVPFPVNSKKSTQEVSTWK